MKSNPDLKCDELFIDLPIPARVHAPLCHVREVGDMCVVGMALPISEGKVTVRGQVGGPITIDNAQRGAREAMIQALAMLKEEHGALKKVKSCVQIRGFVVGTPEFTEHNAVFTAAGQLLGDIFGKKGCHTLTVIGVSSLPQGASVGLELVVKV